MTKKEAAERAAAAERRRKREYYMEHRDEILVKMREYSRTHREQLLPRERAWRENNQVRYFDNQVKYWTRKAESAQDEHEAKVCRWRLKYAIKKLKEAKEKEK
jgi:hypothetical protein